MSSWKMSYASAPTPPSTPTFIPRRITKKPNGKTKSTKYLENPFSINCNLPTAITTTTKLDISYNHQSPIQQTPIQYDYSDNDDNDDDDDDEYDEYINNPPQIRLYQTESHYIIHNNNNKNSNYNLLPTTIDTDGEEDIEQEPSQSSLCCTLYPYETELRT